MSLGLRARAFPALLFVVVAGGWLVAMVLLWETAVPGDLARPDLAAEDYLPQADADRAASYQAFLRIALVAATLAQLAALALFAKKGIAYVRESAAGPIGTGMLLGMLAMAFAWLARFPFSMAALWWERRYELTEVGYVDGAVGEFMQAGGTFLYVCLALLIVMAAAGRWPRWWWVAAVPALLVVGVLAAFTQPYLLPGQERPRDPQLAADTRSLADIQGTSQPDVRIQRTRGLTRAPNAGAAGIGSSQRIILWDNLVEDFSRSEIRVVLAHELTHLSREHIWKHLALLALIAVPIGFITARVTRERGGLAQPQAVPLAVFVVAVVLLVFAPVRAAFSRHLETEADWVALETTREPDAAIGLMQGFTDRGLAAPEHPAWASFLFETHPSVIERVELAEAWRDRNSGR